MDLDFHPPYILRISKKARRASLRVTLGTGLEVVLPTNCDPKVVPEILNGHRAWIERQLKKRAYSKTKLTSLNGESLPPALQLRTIGECWQIKYSACNAQKPSVIEEGKNLLRLDCQVSDIVLGSELLRHWLREKARFALPFMLDNVSKKTGFRYRCVRIKSQRTRWGSCSAKGIINLNDKLLFLPPELTHYILVHELCHTCQLNHSAKFWALVAKFEPAFRHREKALREAWRYIPLWLEK